MCVHVEYERLHVRALRCAFAHMYCSMMYVKPVPKSSAVKSPCASSTIFLAHSCDSSSCTMIAVLVQTFRNIGNQYIQIIVRFQNCAGQYSMHSFI